MEPFKPEEAEAVQFIEPKQLAQWLAQDDSPMVIDVSSDPDVRQAFRGENYLAVSITEFASQINEWDPDSSFVVICQLGQKSFNAAHRLIESDFSCVYSLHGGYEAWKRDQ